MWSKTKSIGIPGDLSGKHTLRLSPRLQDQELCGGGGGGDRSICLCSSPPGVVLGARLGDTWFQSLPHAPPWHVLLILRVLL